MSEALPTGLPPIPVSDLFLVQMLERLTASQPRPSVMIASDFGPTPWLPDEWPVTVVSDGSEIAPSAGRGDVSSVLLLPKWDRPRGRGLSAHQEQVLVAAEGADPLLVLLPASDLDSLTAAEFRKRLFAVWHPEVVVFLRDVLAGVHRMFEAALVVVRPGGGSDRPLRILDATMSEQTREPTAMLDELSRLLRMNGGTTEHGYVLRGVPSHQRLGFRRNDPRRVAFRIALADYGSTTTVRELFDLVPMMPGNRDSPRIDSDDPADEGVRILTGRDVQFGRIADPEPDTRTLTVPVSRQLQVGDVVFRSVNTLRPGVGFVGATVLAQDLPACAGPTVIALRPKPGIPDLVTSFVLRFLASPAAVELAESALAGTMRLGSGELAGMVVPVPDKAMAFALTAITEARDTAALWQVEAEELLASVFDGEVPAENRTRVLRSSRSLRHRISVAEATEQLGQRVRTRYPLPVAARWRGMHAALSTGPSSEGYKLILESAEVLVGYLACVGLALAFDSGVELGATRDLRAKLAKGQGPSFGDWVSVLRELGGKRARGVRATAQADDLCDFLLGAEVEAAVGRLSSRRNDESHVRGVDPADLPEACVLARADLEMLLERASFVEDFPLLLAGGMRWDSLSRTGLLSIQLLAGDHPVVASETLTVQNPDLESGSLYVQDPVGLLHLIRPFVVARTCPTCRVLSTFHVDKCVKGDVVLKSFEHGHVLQDSSIAPALISVGLLDS